KPEKIRKDAIFARTRAWSKFGLRLLHLHPNPSIPKSPMARVSYIEEHDHPQLADLIGKIRAGRRGALINVYKLLLHSPALAAIWLDFVSAARFKVELEGRLRE